MARWRSCAPPTCIRSNCCRKATPNRQPSLGLRCQIRATGRGFDKLTGEPRVPVRVLYSSEELDGGEHGTRNFTLAFGRADTGYYPVVVVFRPLAQSYLLLRKRPGDPPGFFRSLSTRSDFRSIFGYDPMETACRERKTWRTHIGAKSRSGADPTRLMFKKYCGA